MEIQIEILGGGTNKQKQLIHLKSYLEKARISELQNIKIERTDAKAGEMGAGLIKGISSLLLGGAGPFTKLAEALVKYVEIMRSEVKLKNRNGEELVINAKLNKKSINELVDKFYAESRNQPDNVVTKKADSEKKKLEKKEEEVKPKKTEDKSEKEKTKLQDESKPQDEKNVVINIFKEKL